MSIAEQKGTKKKGGVIKKKGKKKGKVYDGLYEYKIPLTRAKRKTDEK